MELSDVMKKFILHWGEMGTRWGVNRTVAQIHALLYISPKPLNAEEIAHTLSIARSNVSTSIKELQGWGILRVVHLLGDRKDHFETLKDVWEMSKIILEERKKREIDPTLDILRECVEKAENAGPEDAQLRVRLADMLEFLETMAAVYEQVKKLPPTTLARVVRMGDKLGKLLTFGGK